MVNMGEFWCAVLLVAAVLAGGCGDDLDGRTACEIHAEAVCRLRVECLAADWADCMSRSVTSCEAVSPGATIELAMVCEESYEGVTCATFRREPIAECDVWR
jgi:hypothetical protein